MASDAMLPASKNCPGDSPASDNTGFHDERFVNTHPLEINQNSRGGRDESGCLKDPGPVPPTEQASKSAGQPASGPNEDTVLRVGMNQGCQDHARQAGSS